MNSSSDDRDSSKPLDETIDLDQQRKSDSLQPTPILRCERVKTNATNIGI